MAHPRGLHLNGDIHFGFEVTADNMRAFADALQEMTGEAVLAGFPAEKEETREDENGNPVAINNATIGYLMDKGMPEQNVPARSFMISGIESVGDKIADAMEQTGTAALDGDQQRVQEGFHAVGLVAENGIRQKIIDGPFVPLAESTLKARARAGGEIGKAAQRELDSRQAGNVESVEDARPLNFTGQMRNAVSYAIRKED